MSAVVKVGPLGRDESTMPVRTVGTATVAGICPGGGGVRATLGTVPTLGLVTLLALWPVGLGMIALPLRTWIGSIVGGGVGVSRTAGVAGSAVGPPPATGDERRHAEDGEEDAIP